MSTSADDHVFVFDLDGDEDGGVYRVAMTNKPEEVNRHAMVDRGDKFQVIATLLDAVHGTTTRIGGVDATLLVANFCFLPSKAKRFISANINWVFTSDDPAIEVSVEQIAPYGSWSLSPVKQTQETTITGRAGVGPSVGPAKANIEGEYGMKRGHDTESNTTVLGSQRMQNRTSGGRDVARWYLAENDVTKTGICRMLQVAVLLHRTALPGKMSKSGPSPRFRGQLNITVVKGGWSEVASKARRVFKDTPEDEAIVFEPGKDLRSGHFNIDNESLEAVDLEQDVMFMGLHESFDDFLEERKARQAGRSNEKNSKEGAANEVEAGDDRPALAVAHRAPAAAQGLPSWVFYVILGVLGMHLWQQMIKDTIFSGK